MKKEITYKDLYEDMKEKYNRILNERDSILQSVYNEMVYQQPIKYSLREKLTKHCKERNLELPEVIKGE